MDCDEKTGSPENQRDNHIIFKNGRVTGVRHNKILSVLWLKIF